MCIRVWICFRFGFKVRSLCSFYLLFVVLVAGKMAESVTFAVGFRLNSLLIFVTILTYSIQIINLTTVAANFPTPVDLPQPALNSTFGAVLEGSKCNFSISSLILFLSISLPRHLVLVQKKEKGL